MARIDFYLLAESGETSRERFACRLAEKAYRLRHSVHIQTDDHHRAAQLDDLLWTFRDGSFVPHERIESANAAVEAPITIGCTPESLRAADLLINLTDAQPPELGPFPRVAEIVTSDADRRQRSRKLFADYRSQGHRLEVHELR
ncbi:MAG TPA: DNA polymerase III subunit chi [Woeseiaceae bacterium]|nr:DNA polymerase III subunit chi [Woeseiaceae bacterium]